MNYAWVQHAALHATCAPNVHPDVAAAQSELLVRVCLRCIDLRARSRNCRSRSSLTATDAVVVVLDECFAGAAALESEPEPEALSSSSSSLLAGRRREPPLFFLCRLPAPASLLFLCLRLALCFLCFLWCFFDFLAGAGASESPSSAELPSLTCFLLELFFSFFFLSRLDDGRSARAAVVLLLLLFGFRPASVSAFGSNFERFVSTTAAGSCLRLVATATATATGAATAASAA